VGSIATQPFARKEREVLELLKARVTIKNIGALLELSTNTVRQRLRVSCELAQVVDEVEMHLFLIQNPDILTRGATCLPGLHIPIMGTPIEGEAVPVKPCGCGNPECLGPVAMHVKTTSREAASAAGEPLPPEVFR
jgi:hypothetical protein